MALFMQTQNMSPTFRDDFGSFDGRIWMNCAHQGPLPLVAVVAAHRAVEEKMSPHLLHDEAFDEIPNRLRSALSELIGRPACEIILGNSASYGIHLLTNGIRWQAGEEVLVVCGDFPANVFPWLLLREFGVIVRFVTPNNHLCLEPEELEQNISRATRLVCVSWINSYTGWRLDLTEISHVCRRHGVLLVLNASQGLGAQAVNLASTPVDALVCSGYKWLCGPFGTGFCWLKPELLDSIKCNQAYWWPLRRWLPNDTVDTELPKIGARQFDVFCTANFFNFAPWIASVEYIAQMGVERIAVYDDSLVTQLIDGVDRRNYRMISSDGPEGKSTLFVLSHREPSKNRQVFDELRNCGIDIAVRKNNLRLSPHIYNTAEQVTRVVDVLNASGS